MMMKCCITWLKNLDIEGWIKVCWTNYSGELRLEASRSSFAQWGIGTYASSTEYWNALCKGQPPTVGQEADKFINNFNNLTKCTKTRQNVTLSLWILLSTKVELISTNVFNWNRFSQKNILISWTVIFANLIRPIKVHRAAKRPITGKPELT